MSAGIDIATDDVERLSHVSDVVGKTVLSECPFEGGVLYEREYGTDGEEPGDYSDIDSGQRPEALAIGKGEGELAKADGGGGIADNTKGVKKAHSPELALIIHAGNAYKPQD